MIARVKMVVVLIFIVLLIDDLCHYIQAFIDQQVIAVQDMGFLFTDVTDNLVIVHKSMCYLLLVMFIYFVTHFFKRSETKTID